MEKTEKIKVHGTSYGKLYITPFDLFSLEKVKELIKKIANQKFRIMTEKKTAEEILEFQLNYSSMLFTDEMRSLYKRHAVKAMHEFAAQELADYKTRLKNHLAYEHNSMRIDWQEMIELIDKL